MGDEMKFFTKLAMFFLILLTGCSSGGDTVITDNMTSKIPQIIIELKPNYVTIEYHYDNMDMGHLYYHVSESGNVVIDPDYYKQNSATRGEVIYYKPLQPLKPMDINIPEYTISRIIALPGEKIKISKGQIYINGNKLDAFYGRATMHGLDEQEYNEFQKNKDPNYVPDPEYNYFGLNKKEITVPAGQVYVLGDSWWRSYDSLSFGPLPIEGIIGKVIGVTGEIKNE